MNKIKKCFGAAAALGLLLSLMPVKALATASSVESASSINKFPYANVGVHDRLDFYGLKVKVIAASATATLLHSGAIFLDAICPMGGTLGKYSMAFDTGDINGASTDIAANFAYAVSPKVYTVTDTTSAAGGKSGCWFPPAPVKIVNGLYGDQNDSGHSTLFYVHCSDGSNPCVP